MSPIIIGATSPMKLAFRRRCLAARLVGKGEGTALALRAAHWVCSRLTELVPTAAPARTSEPAAQGG
jgi:hypothetical protein